MSKNNELMKDDQGVIRWVYELNMWKNPTIIMTVLKVFMLSALFPTLLVAGLELENGLTSALNAFVQVFLIVAGIMVGLLIIAYPMITIINGGKYCVVFEMDDKGVMHTQMQKQFKKNQIVSLVAVVAGLAAGNLQTAGAGLLSATKQSSYSQFSKVTKIKENRRRHVIHVNSGLNHNQIYVDDEAFEEVLEYIMNHSPKADVK